MHLRNLYKGSNNKDIRKKRHINRNIVFTFFQVRKLAFLKSAYIWILILCYSCIYFEDRTNSNITNNHKYPTLNSEKWDFSNASLFIPPDLKCCSKVSLVSNHKKSQGLGLKSKISLDRGYSSYTGLEYMLCTWESNFQFCTETQALLVTPLERLH